MKAEQTAAGAPAFQQTSSFTRRLRIILIIIAVFFLLVLGTSLFTSSSYLRGLQHINTINAIVSNTSLSLEGLIASDQALEKLQLGPQRDFKFVFDENQKLVDQHLARGIQLGQKYPEALNDLLQAERSLKEHRNVVRSLLRLLSQNKSQGIGIDKIRSEILVAQQYSLEAKDLVRSAQIKLKKISEGLFDEIYANRFRPLFAASVLSVLFFAFVIIVGLRITRNLGRYLRNLAAATEAVGRGYLNFQAPVLEQDEFGKLTFEFNQMVRSLRESRRQLTSVVERITTLQHLTASLSQAILPGQVFDIIFKQAFDVLKVKSGAVGLLDQGRKNVILQNIEGYSEEVKKQWGNFTLDANTPMGEVILTGEPIFCSSITELQKYPKVVAYYQAEGVRSMVTLPLIVNGDQIGALTLNYDFEYVFLDSDKEFFLAIARQCSQALHRTQLYSEAQEAVAVRDEFVSIASHELKTPLTPLKLRLQSLSRQVKKGNIASLPTEQLLKTMEDSDKQVNRLTSLIDDLLDVSRISAGKLTLNRENFNLAEMVNEVVDQFKHQFKESHIRLDITAVPEVFGSFDRLRIEQVFINLLSNAAKYAPGRPIEITLAEDSGKAILSVTDQGQGISDEDQSRIFERFERVRNRDNVGGLGLGLYISRQIVEAHGGRIRVESKKGHGAKFVVELPLRGESDSTT